ncbi:MAG: PEP-CTERM sorting domain-containing protein [Thiobacillus sp.]|nr:PEP-CTERM sorting domain-containing protein [Thiobacillus sp.]
MTYIKPLLMFLIAATVVPGVQAASIGTLVSVDVDYLGSVQYLSDARTTPGSISACTELPAAGFCGILLDYSASFASSYANTDYGVNRARVYARSMGFDLVSTAQAISFWTDELTFSGVTPGDVVVLHFHLDGSWNDTAVDFQLGVFDPTLSYDPPADASAPFSDYGHPIEMAEVASAGFNNRYMVGIAFDFVSVQPIVPSGTMENGTISWDFELRLSPVDGRTYTLASVLGLFASIADIEDIDRLTDATPFGSAAAADFDSTAALTQIVLPAGVSVASAAGAAYNVTAVPEADTWAMLLAGLGFVGWAARRRPG